MAMRRRRRRVDWRAASDGAVLAVLVVLPPTIVVRLLKDGDLEGSESGLWVVPMLAVLVGFGLAGHKAARRRPDAPLLHAAAAAALAFAALAAVALVRAAVGGDFTVPLVVTLLLLGQIVVSLAIVGGYVAMRREAAASRRIDVESTGDSPGA